ncbi:hypothetical protein FACS189475_01640 [Betaproteobacteria bacterium]|nr:hypothetical protein FACS189475_01640 [Betaproteobacteria bacterium]
MTNQRVGKINERFRYLAFKKKVSRQDKHGDSQKLEGTHTAEKALRDDLDVKNLVHCQKIGHGSHDKRYGNGNTDDCKNNERYKQQ